MFVLVVALGWAGPSRDRRDLCHLWISTMTQQATLCALLRGVLDDAVELVPEAKRTSSLKACLAETVLVLAAAGHSDPTVLAQLAVRTMQESCRDCYGCGVQKPSYR